jgi:hypothetical protein
MATKEDFKEFVDDTLDNADHILENADDADNHAETVIKPYDPELADLVKRKADGDRKVVKHIQKRVEK